MAEEYHGIFCEDCHSFPCRCKDGSDDGRVRTFGSGATRDTAQGKPDPEGYWSPLAMDRYDEYMLRHQVQADGSVRDSDNWQKGFGLFQLMKSLTRHFRAVWRIHRGWARPNDDDIQDHLCAVIFNAQAYLHELLVAKISKKEGL